jgi:hypothetical protein
MSIKDWFITASATFAGGAVAIALVAIPTFVWLPREFEDLYAQSTAARNESNLARIASEEARAASVSTLDKIDNLIIAIARMDAKPMLDFLIEGENGTFQLSLGGEIDNKFSALLPPDVFDLIAASGEMDSFKYSNFAGDDWVFIDAAAFNQFSLDEQRAIEESLERTKARFVVE